MQLLKSMGKCSEHVFVTLSKSLLCGRHDLEITFESLSQAGIRQHSHGFISRHKVQEM